RFGGDEFVVVAPAVDNEEHAMALAARVFSVVTGPARCGEIDVDVSVSMGLAVSDADTSDAADLLHHADLAMYESKNAGRGRLTLSSRPSETDDRADGLRRDLRHAVESRQLTVHYQRIVPLRDGLVAGWEALARWDHPQHGPIDARRFLGVAEVAGFAGELGDELIRVVCEDQHAIFASDPGFVAINVSLAQIAVEGAAEAVLSRLETGGVDSRSVVVELTEGAFEQGDAVAANLVRLRQAGVRLFLDDFGVGYASLSHLHRFPVDGIKIDSSIVNPVVDENLVRLIVGVATTLDLRTVAEGVETTDQLDAVSRLGVDYAQGFLLARPTRHPEVPSTP
uniref:putative bifunctional diguanylate cyclase/phosphodiesterase n=1 Tax=Ilumatobacter sp. TaxID=1967498 RepID=UPI00261CA12A